MARLIGLTGPAGCGKSTIAKMIVSRWSSKIIRCNECNGKGGWFEQGTAHTDFWVRCTKCVRVHGGIDYSEAERHRFAGPLKDMLRTLGLTEAQVDGDEKELPCDLLGGKTPRQAMQFLGCEFGRDLIDPGLWVRATMLRVDADLTAGKLVVIDDVRFDNEARAIKAREGIVVRLERTTSSAAVTSGHASEAGVSQQLIDVIIPNQDTPDQVARLVLNQLKAL